MNSTLGGLKGGIDYAAYHNIVHVEAGELRVDIDDIGILFQNLAAKLQALAIAPLLIEHERLLDLREDSDVVARVAQRPARLRCT